MATKFEAGKGWYSINVKWARCRCSRGRLLKTQCIWIMCLYLTSRHNVTLGFMRWKKVWLKWIVLRLKVDCFNRWAKRLKSRGWRTLACANGELQHFIFVVFFGSIKAPSKPFLLFFLLPDWLKLNHLKSRMKCDFQTFFSRHFCSNVAETLGVTNYAASSGARNVQKTTFETAEMMLGP